jgi:hypothetical protein
MQARMQSLRGMTFIIMVGVAMMILGMIIIRRFALQEAPTAFKGLQTLRPVHFPVTELLSSMDTLKQMITIRTGEPNNRCRQQPPRRSVDRS